MNIEEIAFKDRKNLVQLNENDLLDIIEFLQQDRKQWINQFTQTHNESVKIQEENQELKDNWVELKEYLNYKSGRAVGEDEYVYDEIYNEMQEMEKNYGNVENNT